MFTWWSEDYFQNPERLLIFGKEDVQILPWCLAFICRFYIQFVVKFYLSFKLSLYMIKRQTLSLYRMGKLCCYCFVIFLLVLFVVLLKCCLWKVELHQIVAGVTTHVIIWNRNQYNAYSWLLTVVFENDLR